MAADPLTSSTADELLQAHAAFDTDDEDLAERPPLNTERDDKAILSPRKRKAVGDLRDEIIDEEVKITKQRRKIPKLDTDKLLSEPGLPKIRNVLRTGELKGKLRWKGKGHEFSDTARLLNFYQMWLDSLYPRAKFMDAVQMVEKAGHTKKMQMYRKSWIDEGKPGFVRREDVDDAFDAQDNAANAANTTRPEHQISTNVEIDQDFDEDPSSMFFGETDEPTTKTQDGPDDDELEALLAQEEDHQGRSSKQRIDVESEGDDDLDAILAQAQTDRSDTQPASGQRSTDSKVRDGAQREDAEEKRKSQNSRNEDKQSSQDGNEDELDDLLNQDVQHDTPEDKLHVGIEDHSQNGEFSDDDLDDLLNNHATTMEPELPSNILNEASTAPSGVNVPGSEEVPELENVVSSSPIPNVHTDELDELMDEHDAAIEERKKHADPDIVEEFFSSSPLQA